MTRFFLATILVLSQFAPARAQEPDEPPNVDLGKPQLALQTGGHTAFVMKVFFTPDCKQLVSVGRDGTVRYWDVPSGELRRTLHVPCYLNPFKHANMAAVSDDRKILVLSGKWILQKEDKTRPYVFINVLEGRIERVLHVNPLDLGVNQCLGLSRDGKHLATGNVKGGAVWDIATAKRVGQFEGDCNSTAFNSAGDKLLVTFGNVLSVLDLANGKLKSTSEDLGSPHSALWLDDRQVVVCIPGGLVVYHTEEKKKVRTLLRGVGINALAWDGEAKGGTLVVGGELPEKQGPCVQHVDVVNGKELRSYEFPEGEAGLIRDVACHGEVVAAACEEVIYLWNKTSGKLLATLGGMERPLLAAGWGKDNRTIAWGQRLDPKAKSASDAIHAVKVFLDQRPLERAINLGELQLAEVADFKDFQRNIFKTGDRQLFVTRAQIVPRTGKSLDLTAITNGSTSGSLLAQDRAVLGMSNGIVRFYDARTGRVINSVTFRHRAAVMGSAPSPNGRFLLTVARDQTMKIWDLSKPAKEQVLLTVHVSGQDWIVWTEQGYYAATPGGEKLMGWTVNNEVGKIATFLPAERFRKQLYRPDVIKLVLEKGSIEEALKTANAALPEKERPATNAVAKLDELLPPVVTLEAGKPNDINEVTFKVSAKAGVKEQPITSLRLFVDGRPFSDSPPANFGKGVADYQKPWLVTLPPGKHTVAILARTADASSLSNEVTIDCTPAKEKPVMHVLAVGIDQYADKDLKLTCAVNDAELIARTFKGACEGELFHQVRTQLISNEKATAKATLDALTALRTDAKHRVKPGDLVVVFFAGHGAKEKNQFYLLTHESKVDNLAGSALSGARLRDELKEFDCQVLLIMDACHSAGFGEQQGKKAILAAKGLKPATDDATREFTRDEVGVTVFCAAMGYEKAAEGMGNGLFTKWLAKAMTETKDVPHRRDDLRQYINHVETYVQDNVARESGNKQHPFLHRPWTVEPFPLRKLPDKSPGER